ncbi:hypothetical protein ACTXT7_012663 [Hymenolepis weldensis]
MAPINSPNYAVPIRQPYQTRYKLPLMNWSVLRNQQLRNTIFVGMNDEKIIESLDMDRFEELFRLSSNSILSKAANEGKSVTSNGENAPDSTTMIDGDVRNSVTSKKSTKKRLMDASTSALTLKPCGKIGGVMMCPALTANNTENHHCYLLETSSACKRVSEKLIERPKLICSPLVEVDETMTGSDSAQNRCTRYQLVKRLTFLSLFIYIIHHQSRLPFDLGVTEVALTQKKEERRTLAQRFLYEEKNLLNVDHGHPGNDWLPEYYYRIFFSTPSCIVVEMMSYCIIVLEFNLEKLYEIHISDKVLNN